MSIYVCIICEKHLSAYPEILDIYKDNFPQDYFWPEGAGVVSVDFPFGSIYDTGGNLNPNPHNWIGVLCDDCFTKKQHLFQMKLL